MGVQRPFFASTDTQRSCHFACPAGIELAALQLASPGQTVLVEEPTYFLAHQIFRDQNLEIVRFCRFRGG